MARNESGHHEKHFGGGGTSSGGTSSGGNDSDKDDKPASSSLSQKEYNEAVDRGQAAQAERDERDKEEAEKARLETVARAYTSTEEEKAAAREALGEREDPSDKETDAFLTEYEFGQLLTDESGFTTTRGGTITEFIDREERILEKERGSKVRDSNSFFENTVIRINESIEAFSDDFIGESLDVVSNPYVQVGYALATGGASAVGTVGFGLAHQTYDYFTERNVLDETLSDLGSTIGGLAGPLGSAFGGAIAQDVAFGTQRTGLALAEQAIGVGMADIFAEPAVKLGRDIFGSSDDAGLATVAVAGVGLKYAKEQAVGALRAAPPSKGISSDKPEYREDKKDALSTASIDVASKALAVSMAPGVVYKSPWGTGSFTQEQKPAYQTTAAYKGGYRSGGYYQGRSSFYN